MRVKCTITIDDAEFTATSSGEQNDGDAIAMAIEGCIAAVCAVEPLIAPSFVVATICVNSEVAALRAAGSAELDLDLNGGYDDHFLVVASKSAPTDHKRLPPNIIAVPDIAAARAALQG